MTVYLALKDLIRNRGRFFLFSLVIALITVLVLFVAALADGLGNGNKEYLEKLDADLIVYKSNVDLSIGASRLDRSKLNIIRRTPGVKDAGPVSFTSVVLFTGSSKTNIALIGVEPGRPGEPPVVLGAPLANKYAKEATVDRNIAARTGLRVGDEFRLKSIQGTEEEFFTLRVAGITDGRQYSLQPSVIVSTITFDRIRPKAAPGDTQPELSNIIAVQLAQPVDLQQMAAALQAQDSQIQAVDRQTAYQNTPGYSAQQSTLATLQFFSLLVGILIIGGFFQIQTLQKVPQIGMLKAIGAANTIIATNAVTQIIVVTLAGIAMGTLVTLALSLTFPASVPIVFSPNTVLIGILSLMTIGPAGGLVSVRYAIRVEPLTALGLAA